MTDKILELINASGSKAKSEVLEKYKDDDYMRKTLFYSLNPLLSYNISEKTLRVKDYTPNTPSVLFKDIFECCEYLSRLRGLDNATLNQVLDLLYTKYSDDEREIYIKLLAKTLRLGVTAKTVNKVITGLIPEWEVQQAYPIEKYPITEGEKFWLTQKLNGVRATFYNGQLIARSGIAFTGLDHILSELSWVSLAGFVLDGELTLKDKDGLSDNEAFRVATGILNSENENKTEICFTVFDAIPVIDFESLSPSTLYETRRYTLEIFASSFRNASYVSVLPVLYYGSDISKIDEFLERMVEEDKEGLMVNLNVPYKRTRHKGILKVKRFYTMDLLITGFEEGGGRLSKTLGSLLVDFEGNTVKVGSGFTDEQRNELWSYRDELIGKLCEVKYKEISYDKDTKLKSLQFPVFITIRNDKTEPSYE